MKSTKMLELLAISATIAIAALYWENLGGKASAQSDDAINSPEAFLETARLTAADGAENDYFGSSVVVSGDFAVVGSYNDDTVRGDGAGSAFVYVRNGNVWTLQQKLTAADGAADDNFGVAVAMSGDTIVIGADRDDTAAGSAYVFTRNGNVWTQQQKLTAFDRSGFDLFGHSVSISGETVVVGSFNADTPGAVDSGAAYVFTRSVGVWTLQQKLIASDADFRDNFGFSVAMGGDTVVVGAYQDDLVAGVDSGSAYVFTRTGSQWAQQQKLTASDAAEGDFFGVSAAISGNTVVIGAFFDDTVRGDSAGSAYVFIRTGTVWSQQQHLFASDGAAIDDFGYSVAISGNAIVVGAVAGDTSAGTNSGSAYLFTRTGTVWTEQQELAASNGGSPEDYFGTSVAVSGNTIIVGAFFDDLPVGENAGSAYIFATPGLNIGGRVTTPSGLILRNAAVLLTDSQNVKRAATTSSFGIYAFDNVVVGETYVISVGSKRFRFSPQILQFTASASNVDFVGLE